jgi:EAL domain-containing protein (putative c-di-GMP-specific phosphodiesterase class I)
MLREGIRFGHVAVNSAAAKFSRGSFAKLLLAKLKAAEIPPKCFQLEVTGDDPDNAAITNAVIQLSRSSASASWRRGSGRKASTNSCSMPAARSDRLPL